MDLSLTEHQEMLKGTAADFVRHEAPSHQITDWAKNNVGFVPELWRKVAQMGWLGMATPVEYGGAGVSCTDAAVVFEQLGRGPVPGPIFNSGFLAPLLFLEGGSDEQKDQYLPALAQGRAIATLAISEPTPKYGPEYIQMTAERKNGDYLLNGTKMWVHDAEAADTLICAVRTSELASTGLRQRGGAFPEALEGTGEGITLLVVDKSSPGIAVRRLEGFMAAACEVEFKNVFVPRSAVLGGEGKGWDVLERAAQKALPVMCAFQVGGCQEVFDFTAEYTRTRVVFSQPIGRFQRVQDHVIDLSIHMDGARWTTNQALWAIDTGQPDARAMVHLSKAKASEGYCRACDCSLEVHAGVGTDKAHPLYPHLIMSRTLYPYLGDPRYHKRAMTDAWDM